MSSAEHFRFRLYLAGESPNSLKALATFQAFCADRLKGRYDLEMVDVMREPKRALEDGVYLTPTLLQISPAPVRRIIGNLKDQAALGEMLGIF